MKLPFDAEEARAALMKADPELGAWIRTHGECALERRPLTSTFEALATAVLFQQVHANAARAIQKRMEEAVSGGRFPTPEEFQAGSDEVLRGAGLSQNKLLAIRDLAAHALDGRLPEPARLRKMDDEAIVEALVSVRGIGRWTAEMLLIFRLGRPDVLPVGDFGVREGFRLLRGDAEQPTPKALAAHGERWGPWRSVAAWYLWRRADAEKERRVEATKAARAAAKPKAAKAPAKARSAKSKPGKGKG